jgi:hypothetical protein
MLGIRPEPADQRVVNVGYRRHADRRRGRIRARGGKRGCSTHLMIRGARQQYDVSAFFVNSIPRYRDAYMNK